jgi:hypothetical protein
MTLDELMEKITANDVPDRWYCIDDGLKTDALHLYKNYSKWEYFYLDERGNRNDFIVFYSDDEAFEFLWGQIESQLQLLRPKS